MGEVWQDFVIKCFQHNVAYNRESCEHICYDQCIGQDVECLTGLEVDSDSLLCIWSESEYRKKAKGNFDYCRQQECKVHHHWVLFRVSHASLHTRENCVGSVAEDDDTKTNREGIDVEWGNIVDRHVLVLGYGVDDDC